MFDDQQQPNQNPKPTSPLTPQLPKVDDMFSRTDPTVAGQNVKIPVQPGQASQMKPTSLPDEDLYGGNSIFSNKVLLLEILGLFLIIFIGGGFLIYNIFLKSDGSAINTNSDNNQPVTNNQVNTNQPVDNNSNDDQNQNNQNIEPVKIEDADGDGLTDNEEKKLGTDYKNTDTDSDGLNDRAEVYIYNTDPLNPDTDGDGYKDGQEVINNYDPTRPGSARLYQIPE